MQFCVKANQQYSLCSVSNLSHVVRALFILIKSSNYILPNRTDLFFIKLAAHYAGDITMQYSLNHSVISRYENCIFRSLDGMNKICSQTEFLTLLVPTNCTVEYRILFPNCSQQQDNTGTQGQCSVRMCLLQFDTIFGTSVNRNSRSF